MKFLVENKQIFTSLSRVLNIKRLFFNMYKFFV